ncbi:exo-alpha-sialidase [Trypanosoma cruzi]|nr:exo-alpha-sialidase [Trypanosoma cruzi]
MTAPGTHSDCHHQQEPRRALLPRVSTHRTTPTHKITSGWQKTTAALRSTHALPPPAISPLSPPSHPLRRRCTSPRTAVESLAVKYTAGEARRHLQLLGRNRSALVPATLNNTPLTGRTLPTSRPQHVEGTHGGLPSSLPARHRSLAARQGGHPRHGTPLAAASPMLRVGHTKAESRITDSHSSSGKHTDAGDERQTSRSRRGHTPAAHGQSSSPSLLSLACSLQHKPTPRQRRAEAKRETSHTATHRHPVRREWRTTTDPPIRHAAMNRISLSSPCSWQHRNAV